MTLSNYIAGINNSANTNCNLINSCEDFDFLIKRHDTRPSFRICAKECDEILDYSDSNLILEVNIWFDANIKNEIDDEIDYFELTNLDSFNQVMVGDIIVVQKPRLPEHMLVIAFDENNKLIKVQRGYHNTNVSSLKRNSKLKIFRNMNATAKIESVYEDIILEDGNVQKNTLTETYFNYDFDIKDTCLAGCYFLEFKLLKIKEQTSDFKALSYENISFTSEDLSLIDFGCYLDDTIEWVRRFPIDKEAYKIKVLETPTAEI
jgi:hypothetical protein